MTQLLVSCFGTIYDSTPTKTPGVMSSKRRDRTDEVINATAIHMQTRADANKDSPGFWQYIFPGAGTLTWESEKKEAGTDG